MITDNNYKPSPPMGTFVFLDLLIETKLCHPVYFADEDFHLISTQVTKVQDAHHMCVLQLAGTRQHLLCKTNISSCGIRTRFWSNCVVTGGLGGYLAQEGRLH